MLRSLRLCAAASALLWAAVGAQAQQDTAKDKSAKPAPAAKPAAKPGAVAGRDWTKIDTNKDNYISPEEMEVWLKANGPDAK